MIQHLNSVNIELGTLCCLDKMGQKIGCLDKMGVAKQREVLQALYHHCANGVKPVSWYVAQNAQMNNNDPIWVPN